MDNTNPVSMLLYVLRRLRDEGKQDKEYGICQNAYDLLHNDKETHLLWDADPKEAADIMDDLMPEWPKASNTIGFPVPGGVNAYQEAADKGTLWSKRTKYGKLRWELLNWLIEKCESMEKEQCKYSEKK